MKKPDHRKNVATIIECFNELLDFYKLGPFEPTDDCRNIFMQQTEISYEINDHFLLLEVPDTWLEDSRLLQLGDYLGKTIGLNYTVLRGKEDEGDA